MCSPVKPGELRTALLKVLSDDCKKSWEGYKEFRALVQQWYDWKYDPAGVLSGDYLDCLCDGLNRIGCSGTPATPH